jgi:transcriptional regulator with XRE-family HTH domain
MIQPMIQPLFRIYTRSYLSDITGFSKTHLSRVSTGHAPLTRSFIARVCQALGRPEGELFLPEAMAAGVGSQAQEKQ